MSLKVSSKKFLIALLSIYICLCGVLIFKSGLFLQADKSLGEGIIVLASDVDGHVDGDAEIVSGSQLSAAPESIRSAVDFSAISGPAVITTIGSVVPEVSGNDFLLALELTSKGAGIATASLRDYDDRDPKDPKPMKILTPVGDRLFSMSSRRLLLTDYGLALPMDKLNWISTGSETLPDGSQKAGFETVITNGGRDAIKLIRTFTLAPNSYMLNCDLTVSNLSDSDFNLANEILAAVGITREGARMDMRTITGAFIDHDGVISTVKNNVRKLSKDDASPVELLHKEADRQFIWASIASKYFAAIVRPVPAGADEISAGWIERKSGYYYPPNPATGQTEANIGVAMRTRTAQVAAGGKVRYSFEIFLGPKDRDMFIDNEHYSKLGFVNVVDFQACGGNLFRPLSFFILGSMKWMYNFFWPHNYGIVIIIFVFIIRILMHPVTKKSQVSMMKMSKLGPMAEEIKKKYANNKAEQQKQMMQLYKQHGASPILGCLPMLIQMPIWIALYSAIYASIELRGAAFLPFWITDLSAPDALFTLPAATASIPIIGSLIGTNFNLLPIFLAAAMFAQQKLMPSSASSSNSQAAQQQKMMMWMMPIMMLVFLFRAPSGLNLYIMSSTTAGVIEQYVIRKHIREKEAAEQVGLVSATSKTGGKFRKKKPKPPIKFN